MFKHFERKLYAFYLWIDVVWLSSEFQPSNEQEFEGGIHEKRREKKNSKEWKTHVKYLYEAQMTQKKSAKAGKNFRRGRGIFWLDRIDIPLHDTKIGCIQLLWAGAKIYKFSFLLRAVPLSLKVLICFFSVPSSFA